MPNAHLTHHRAKVLSIELVKDIEGVEFTYSNIHGDLYVWLKVVDSASYLGDLFNSAGTKEDLIIDRVKKGKACTVNAVSLCAEITMGLLYTIPTLLLLYRSVFLSVVIYNSKTRSN